MGDNPEPIAVNGHNYLSITHQKDGTYFFQFTKPVRIQNGNYTQIRLPENLGHNITQELRYNTNASELGLIVTENRISLIENAILTHRKSIAESVAEDALLPEGKMIEEEDYDTLAGLAQAVQTKKPIAQKPMRKQRK